MSHDYLERILKARVYDVAMSHYRNHGCDYGRVLASVQIPPSERVRSPIERDQVPSSAPRGRERSINAVNPMPRAPRARAA